MDEETTKWIRHLRPVCTEPLDLELENKATVGFDSEIEKYPELKNLVQKMLDLINEKVRDEGQRSLKDTKAYLSIIPVHLIEYKNINQSKTPQCSGQVLVAGSPPKVHFILKHRKIQQIEKYVKR